MLALFNFQLKEIENINPFGSEKRSYSLHWFGFTDSFYWLHIGGHEVFRYSNEFISEYPDCFDLPYVDYYLARLIEDLAEILPAITTPIPDPIFSYINSIENMESLLKKIDLWEEYYLENDEQEDSAEYDDIFSPATDWLWNRKLYTGYLRGGPSLRFFRNQNKIIIRWNCEYERDGTKMWVESKGEYILGFQELVNEVEDFMNRFWTQMGMRIDLVLKGFSRPGIKVDLDALPIEHLERKKQMDRMIESLKSDLLKQEMDWRVVEKALNIISH